MAKIWPVFEGIEPTLGGPWIEMPLGEVISLFDLRPADFISDLETTPRFGPQDRVFLSDGYRHVVVEVEADEAQQEAWRSGFYRARTTPSEAFRKLIEHALVAAVGSENVVRVQHESTVDLSGRSALKITVVITPEAVRKLRGKKALDTLIALKDMLRRLREDRTPILEYATEAELAENANP